jgi:hypothetical protein
MLQFICQYLVFKSETIEMQRRQKSDIYATKDYNSAVKLAANIGNKRQPAASGETGLID